MECSSVLPNASNRVIRASGATMSPPPPPQMPPSTQRNQGNNRNFSAEDGFILVREVHAARTNLATYVNVKRCFNNAAEKDNANRYLIKMVTSRSAQYQLRTLMAKYEKEDRRDRLGSGSSGEFGNG